MKKIFKISILLQLLCLAPMLAQEESEQVIVIPKESTLLQKCFMNLNGAKKTYCVAVGERNKVHYAIDLSTGNIIKIWKGDFIEATTMWTGRGQEQLAKPLGEKILTLENEIPFITNNNSKQDYTNPIFEGYALDKIGNPSFKYKLGNTSVVDHLWSEKNDTQKLNRSLKFTYKENSPIEEALILANGNKIEKIKRNLYSVNDMSYVIKIDSKTKNEPRIVKTNTGNHLTILLSDIKDELTFNYSILW